jgi:hypothetical protein
VDDHEPKVRIEIEVNGTKFEEDHNQRTGLQIKEAAIAAGAKLQLGYVLDLETSHGKERIADDKEVDLKDGMRFRAHPGGHDS